MSCAEVEFVRRFRDAGWNAWWLATCGHRNEDWHRYMAVPFGARTTILEPPLAILPGKLGARVLVGGPAGWPDVIAWRDPEQPVFLESKGPNDKGTSQTAWITAMALRRVLRQRDFTKVDWTPAEVATERGLAAEAEGSG